MLSCCPAAQLCATPQTAACQAPLSLGFPRQGYWSRLPFRTWEDLPEPGTEPTSPASPALAHRLFTTAPYGKTLLKPQVWKSLDGLQLAIFNSQKWIVQKIQCESIHYFTGTFPQLWIYKLMLCVYILSCNENTRRLLLEIKCAGLWRAPRVGVEAWKKKKESSSWDTLHISYERLAIVDTQYSASSSTKYLKALSPHFFPIFTT